MFHLHLFHETQSSWYLEQCSNIFDNGIHKTNKNGQEKGLFSASKPADCEQYFGTITDVLRFRFLEENITNVL